MTEEQYKIEYEEALKKNIGIDRMSEAEETEYLGKLKILNNKTTCPYPHTSHSKFSSKF